MAGAHQRINNYITVTKLTVTRERIHTRALGAPWGGSNQRGGKKKKYHRGGKEDRRRAAAGLRASNLSTNRIPPSDGSSCRAPRRSSRRRTRTLFREESIENCSVERRLVLDSKIPRREEEGALFSKGSKIGPSTASVTLLPASPSTACVI